jgi:CheY-like chemotaxis protein
MRTLLVSGHVADHDVLGGIASGNVSVETARDGRAGRVFMGKERFDVAVLDWSLSAPSAQELLREIRASELDSHTYVIAIMTNPSPFAIASAFQSGVDDIVRRPLVREEVVGRVGALDRIKRWASKVLSGKTLDWSGGTDLTALHAWADADRSIRSDLESVIGRELAASATHPVPKDGLCAEIPLTLATEGVDVCLRVSVGERSMHALGALVFGQEMPTDAIRDVLREFANTAAGAFKRAAETEGVVLTTGIPTDVSPSLVQARTGPLVREFALRTTDGPIELHCRLSIKSRSIERLPPHKLAEGMVVARDLMSDNGALLVPSGTRLTEATVHRLSQLLRATTVVEIARAA